MSASRLRPSIILKVTLLGFLAGVIFCSWGWDTDGHGLGNGLYTDLIIIAVLIISVYQLFARKVQKSSRPTIIFLIIIGGLLAGLVYQDHLPGPGSVAHRTDQEVRLEGTVVYQKISGGNQQLRLADLQVDETAVQDRALVYTGEYPSFNYGDRVVVRCELEAPEPFEGFRYDRYLASKNVYATCYTREAPLLIATDQGNPAKALVMRLRSTLLERIDQTFGEPHGSLLAGLLLGEQRFSDEWQDIFLRTGTTHIVAASGYNVSVVTFILFGVLVYFGVRRQQAFWFLLVAIAGYVILAGAEAAVMRAGIMAAIVLVARQLGRKTDMFGVILLTVAIMLVANPFLLRDDVGFQLSVASTIALVYFAPLVEAKFKFIPEALTIRESFTATVAATTITLPIIIINFARLSIIGPLANLLILPFVPYAMAFGALAIVVSFLSSSLAAAVGAPAWALLTLILTIARSLAALPFATIEIGQSTITLLAIIATGIIIILWRYLSGKAAAASRSSPPA